MANFRLALKVNKKDQGSKFKCHELTLGALSNNNNNKRDQSVVSVENIWTSLSGTSVPTSEARHIQKAWKAGGGKPH